VEKSEMTVKPHGIYSKLFALFDKNWLFVDVVTVYIPKQTDILWNENATKKQEKKETVSLSYLFILLIK
jgi:hypothetical protein